MKISVGKDRNTGKEIYRCIYENGNANYQDVSGHVVEEDSLNLDSKATIVK